MSHVIQPPPRSCSYISFLFLLAFFTSPSDITYHFSKTFRKTSFNIISTTYRSKHDKKDSAKLIICTFSYPPPPLSHPTPTHYIYWWFITKKCCLMLTVTLTLSTKKITLTIIWHSYGFYRTVPMQRIEINSLSLSCLKNQKYPLPLWSLHALRKRTTCLVFDKNFILYHVSLGSKLRSIKLTIPESHNQYSMINKV